MKKLPIGIQTFSKIIEGEFTYVDKTSIAHALVKEGGYYFLSRPRRFGKSLFLDTLKDIFEGKKQLFKGLAIYDKWDWDDKYPVLRVSLGSGVEKDINQLFPRLRWLLEDAEDDLKIKCNSKNPVVCFKELIKKAHEKYGKKVVILIDEYDKPILDNITDSKVARLMRDAMMNFYAVIKDNDAYIRFVFITGVSKFSKMNLFSGLNNLNDITLDEKYATICGYTHNDLRTEFKDLLEGADLEMVRKWYNGYNYLGEKVYNPFDILLFIDKGFRYENFWWETGNPSFLIDMLKEGEYFIPKLEHFLATKEVLNTFDVDHIELIALLWQTGYLTITEEISDDMGMSYQLGIPNKEIQLSLNSLFITYLTTQTAEKLSLQRSILQTIKSANPDGLKDALYTLFASIPYHNFTNNKLSDYEGYYASVVYAYLASLGMTIVPEDITNLGRIDLTLQYRDKVFIIEFKLSEKATGSALRQIKEKRYFEKYSSSKEVYLIGIEFSREQRNIIGYEWEKM